MMHRRTLNSLLLTSFMVVMAASLSFANTVTVESKSNLPRCQDQSANVEIAPSQSINAAEVVLEITAGGNGGFVTINSITFDAGILTNLPDVITDLSGVDGVSPDTVRFSAMNLGSGSPLAAGSYTLATIDFTTSNICSDVVTIDNAVFVYPNPTAPITTQFADVNGAIVPVGFTAGTLGIENQAPVMAPIANASLPWGGIYTGSAAATDADTAGTCGETLAYAKVSGPTDMTVNTSTGAITWVTTGADVCDNPVEVSVTDSCGAVATQTFNINVTNIAPTITCPDAQSLCFGETLTTSVTFDDPDNGPFGPFFTLVSFDGPGTVMVNPATGSVTWATLADPNYTGIFTIVVEVSDSAELCTESPNNADTCSFTVEVNAMAVTIQNQAGSGFGVIQGQETTVSIDILDSAYNNSPIAGFDLLIKYDNSAMSLIGVDKGTFIDNCGWEYFQYRFGPNGNCTGGCPSGIVRVVAIAESNDGVDFTGCYDNSGNSLTQLALLRFLVSNDRTLECQVAPIRFVWYDCNDNTLSNVVGDTLIMSSHVYDFNGSEITDTSAAFPTFGGANSSCDVSAKGAPDRCSGFWDGSVKIACADSIDAPGDININNIAYEIADAVMFTNYFIEGLGAFGTHPDGSIAASDVNKDGIALSVADLVYLIRVVVGDALPYPKSVVAKINYTIDNGVIGVSGVTEIGAAYIVVAGDVDPTLLADNMDMLYKFDGTNTNIIVHPNYETGEGFVGEFISGIDGEILTLEMATIDGQPVAAKNIPTNYALAQNYPNPFNPTTTIAFSSPEAGDYSLTIFNVNGQVVETISGTLTAPGNVKVEWDASRLASGVYLYKLNINNFSKVQKAVLLK